MKTVDRQSRVASVDALRGLVMIIMALDHTRDFFHADAMLYQPEDLSRTNVILFFTRWVTHICAPTFMFTAGLGAFFWLKRSGKTTIQLSRFLWTRGLWLMLLEVTVLRFAMSFGLFSGPVLLTVLWALGLSMIVLGFLIWLPIRLIAVFSILVIVLQHLLDKVPIEKFGSAEWLWHIVRQPGMVDAGGIIVIVAYTLVAWFAVMALGFSAGPLMLEEERQRRRTLVYIGLGLIVAFLVIRGINVYGDPVPWSTKVPGMTILSFLKCNKYPPSLDFLLMTLGPALILLAWLDGMRCSIQSADRLWTCTALLFHPAHDACSRADDSGGSREVREDWVSLHPRAFDRWLSKTLSRELRLSVVARLRHVGSGCRPHVPALSLVFTSQGTTP